MSANLHPAGSPAANVLIEALDQYVANQDDYIEGESKPDPAEIEKLRVARLILERLQKDLLAAVGA